MQKRHLFELNSNTIGFGTGSCSDDNVYNGKLDFLLNYIFGKRGRKI